MYVKPKKKKKKAKKKGGGGAGAEDELVEDAQFHYFIRVVLYSAVIALPRAPMSPLHSAHCISPTSLISTHNCCQ